MPVPMLISKDYAAQLRKTINPDKASKSSTSSFTFTYESPETTHISIVDAKRNAVSLTYTLEYGYGSRIVVPGAGFLLNNEMGDFNAAPGLTDDRGLIGTDANLAPLFEQNRARMPALDNRPDLAVERVTEGAVGGHRVDPPLMAPATSEAILRAVNAVQAATPAAVAATAA